MPTNYPYTTVETSRSYGLNPKLRGRCYCPYPNYQHGQLCDENSRLVLWRTETTGTCLPDEKRPWLCRYQAVTKKTTVYTGEDGDEICEKRLNGREFDDKWKRYAR